MFDEFNPVFRANPFYPSYKKIEKWDKMKEIPSKEIDAQLEDMQKLCDGLLNGLTRVRFADKGKIRQFQIMMQGWIDEIRGDLSNTDKFLLRDGYYVRI